MLMGMFTVNSKTTKALIWHFNYKLDTLSSITCLCALSLLKACVPVKILCSQYVSIVCL
jgi:hypothetical protein